MITNRDSLWEREPAMYHKGSLADLERLFPVTRALATSYPDDYRYYLN